MWLRYFFLLGIFLNYCNGSEDGADTDSDSSRKILGSSVVTSVSVVMDTGNGKKTFYTDAVGKPQSKPSNPSELASPIELLNPDRYEFYTFDDNGDLVKRLMSLGEIKSIIATGDSDAFDLDSFTSQGFLPEKRVSDVVSNVQTVLKEEMEILKDPLSKPIFDTPDVSDSWSMILPAIFGNSGEDIKPEKPIAHVTADTIMLEPHMQISHTTPAPQKVDIILSSSTTIKNRPYSSSTHRPSSISTPSTTFGQPVYYSSQALLTTQKLSSTTEPSIKVEIFSNSMSTTDTNPNNASITEEERPIWKDEPLPTRPHNASITEEERPIWKDEPLPTRPPILHISRPSLIRNTTNISATHPTTVSYTSTTASTVSQLLVEVDLPSSRPTTTQFTTSSNEELTQNINEDSIPTIPQLSSTSFRPSPVQITSLTDQTTNGPSSTTVSPLNNTSSSTTISGSFTSKMPLLISTLNIPVNNSSLVTTTASRLTIKPQLTSSNTVSNLYSTSSNLNMPDATTAHLTSTVPLSVTDNSEQISEDLITKESLSNVFTQIPKVTTSSSTETLSNKQSTWGPSINDTELFNIFKKTIAKGTTEYIKDVVPIAINKIEEYDLETTTLKDVTMRNTFQTNGYSESIDDDLSTLPTELFDHKVIPLSNEFDNLTTILPPLLNSLSDNQKISASELLDQLLVTTNIYEINTELTSAKLNTSDFDVRFDNTEENQKPTSSDQDSKPLTTTTDHDVISYPPTTDMTLMQSIEQLLSQAVGDIETTLNQTVGSVTLKELLQNSSKKNMTEFIKESATIASEITIDQTQSKTEQEPIYTTEETHQNAESTITNNDNLSSSVDALFSQVYDDANVIITEKPTVGITYRRADDDVNGTTQRYVANVETSTETINESTTLNLTENSTTRHNETEQETTTYYFVVKKEANISPIKENITILDLIKNRTKPAKADLRLEQGLIEEEMKHISLLFNGTTESSLPTNDTLNQSETNFVVINYTFVEKDKSNDSAEQSTIINNLTTTPNNNNDQYTTPNNDQDTTPNNAQDTTPNNAQDTTPNNDQDTTSEQYQPTEQYISTTSQIDTTTNNLLFTELGIQEVTTTRNKAEEKTTSTTTTKPTLKPKKQPKPSIVITVNGNNTIVTENGKLVANKTISAPLSNSLEKKQALNKEITTSTIKPLQFIEKHSTKDQTWTLVSTVRPQHSSSQSVPSLTLPYQEVVNPPVHVDLVPKPMQGFGLEESTSSLSTDVYQFAQLCNELAFGFWKTATSGLSSARSVFVSPFAAISMLAMVFLGAKGATSEEMNEILKLDDMVTFNPHLTFKNVSESITDEPYSGVAVTTMIRELFSDRSKGKLLDFYKNRVKAFYDGHVEEVGYREIGDVIRRRTNLLIKKYTNGKYSEFLRDSSIIARPPLSGVTVNIFETDCSHTSTEGRDGELHFIVLPSIRQRRLVPIPAVVYRTGFLAGYEPSLDATAVSLGTKDQVVSTILVIPGQQGIAALGDGLARLEKRLVESSFKKGAWSRLLRSLIPRPGLEVQIPRFSHRSIINATNTLQRMGLHELFNPQSADLRGLSGIANELHLSDVLQINSFATCGEKRIDNTHHSEVYPATTLRSRTVRYLYDVPKLDIDQEPRDYQRAFHDPLHNPSFLALPLSLRPRQARIPEIPRLRFDRPFLYFIRHNPTGLILHMGRFNPRLLP